MVCFQCFSEYYFRDQGRKHRGEDSPLEYTQDPSLLDLYLSQLASWTKPPLLAKWLPSSASLQKWERALQCQAQLPTHVLFLILFLIFHLRLQGHCKVSFPEICLLPQGVRSTPELIFLRCYRGSLQLLKLKWGVCSHTGKVYHRLPWSLLVLKIPHKLGSCEPLHDIRNDLWMKYLLVMFYSVLASSSSEQHMWSYPLGFSEVLWMTWW